MNCNSGNEIPRRPMRRTGVEIPQVVFGISAFGNLYQDMQDEVCFDIVKQMLQHNLGSIALDCAGKYGAGLALERLGRILAELQVPKHRVLISNKLGWRRIPLQSKEPTFEPGVWVNIKDDAVQDISYDGILRCWEEGSRLLGNYQTHLVSVHDPDEYLAAATSDADRHQRWSDILEAYKALAELRDQGVVKAIGVGSKDWLVPKKLVEKNVDLDWVMLATSFTVYRHDAELIRFIDWLHEREILVINSAIFHGGFLVGSEYFDYRKVNANCASDIELLNWRNRFQSICSRHNVEPAAACANFAISHPNIAALALNTSRAERVASNLRLGNAAICDEFWLEMKGQGLISRSYPHLG